MRIITPELNLTTQQLLLDADRLSPKDSRVVPFSHRLKARFMNRWSKKLVGQNGKNSFVIGAAFQAGKASAYLFLVAIIAVGGTRVIRGIFPGDPILESTLVEPNPSFIHTAQLVGRVCAISKERNAADLIGLSRAIAEAGLRYSLAPELILAVISAESRCNNSVKSHKGATGIMQLMPATAAELGIKDLSHLASNIDGGSRYLAKMLEMFDGNIELAIAAYNAGPYSVKRNRGIPPFGETKLYVKKVVKSYENLRTIVDERPV